MTESFLVLMYDPFLMNRLRLSLLWSKDIIIIITFVMNIDYIQCDPYKVPSNRGQFFSRTSILLQIKVNRHVGKTQQQLLQGPLQKQLPNLPYIGQGQPNIQAPLPYLYLQPMSVIYTVLLHLPLSCLILLGYTTTLQSNVSFVLDKWQLGVMMLKYDDNSTLERIKNQSRICRFYSWDQKSI